MHPSDALTLESDDSQGAARAVLAVIGYVNGWSPKADLALQIIEPYQAYARYRGIPESRSANIVSQVCGVSGDCHNLRGEVELAAAWYQLSIRYRKDTGFPQAYARLVVDHELRDHYQPALEAYRQSCADWFQRPWLQRAIYAVLAFVLVNRCRPSWIYEQLKDRRLLAQLESLAEGEPEIFRV